MAVADAEKIAKGGGSLPPWLGGPISFLPRKLGEGKSFLAEVRAELKKVTWPSKQEVQTTTVVVIFTTIFFGFYLWGLDLLMTQLLSRVLR